MGKSDVLPIIMLTFGIIAQLFYIANINNSVTCFVERHIFYSYIGWFLLKPYFDNFAEYNIMEMETTIRVKDKDFSKFISSETIDSAIQKVAQEINKDTVTENPLFLIVLNGAFMFAADLLKKINVDCNISFVKLASYSGTQSTNIVKELIGLNEDLKGRSVIVVEDIIDTGKTLDVLLERLKEHNAGKIRIATLLFKPAAFTCDFPIDYVGMEIPNDFIVGYGLDYDGYARNLPDIYKIVE
jgi:hypoxanthine phosphoribosyltransferase